MLASNMWVRTRSPGFIRSVWLLGVKVAPLDSCGLGGPAGTPFRWMKAKFTGSMQLLFMLPAALASGHRLVQSRPVVRVGYRPGRAVQLDVAVVGFPPGHRGMNGQPRVAQQIGGLP
jgi:hypothetical protein